MGVRIKKRGSKWYVYVNDHGRRKNRCVGSREAADRVRCEIEARLALGDQGFLQDGGKPVPLFKDFAQGWLETYAEVECKPSTKRSYEQLLRVHVTPRFGEKKVNDIRRDAVKKFVSELSRETQKIEVVAVPKYSKNTLRLIVCALRTVLNAAVEDGLIENNPAARIGRFAKERKTTSPSQRYDAQRN